MRINKRLVIALVMISLIFGYDIWRSQAGNFTVIRSDESYTLPDTSDNRININKADIDELCQLDGIGPATAEKIIEYRKATPFKSIDELLNIKGIGENKFLQIKDLIKVEL